MKRYENVVYTMDEKIPQVTQFVIIFDKGGDVSSAIFKNGYFLNNKGQNVSPNNIVGWMPNVNLKYMEECE